MRNAELTAADPTTREALAPSLWKGDLAGGDEAAEARSFQFYWHLLQRHLWRIVAAAALVALLVGLVALKLPKQYGATALLRVDLSTSANLGSNGRAAGTSSDATLLTTTEAQIVTSPTVLLNAAHQLHLESNPLYLGKMGPILPGSTADDQILPILAKQVSVSQPFNTELMQVHVEAATPELARDLANEIASQFLKHEYASRAQALEDSSASMAQQLDRLRAQMERDQTALIRYESTNDVLDPDDKQNINNARLGQINQDLSDAESNRIRMEADYRVSLSQDLDAISGLPQGQALLPLKQQEEQDQRSLSRIAQVDGPNHPLYRQQLAVVNHDQAALLALADNIRRQIAVQYTDAVAREELIQGSLNAEKRAMDAFNMRAIQYHALKAAADSSSQLYFGLQQHMQDAAVAATLHGEDLRIVNPARAQAKPTSPHPLLAAAMAGFFGLLLGLGAVIARGVMNKSLSEPEQVEHWLRLPVAGTLPLLAARDAVQALRPRSFLAQEAEQDEGELEAARSGSEVFHEAITSLQSALAFKLGHGSFFSLAVVSALPAEGKSTVAANLATAFSILGGPTLLIDADLRKPNVHRKFGVSNNQGLSWLLRGKGRLEDNVVHVTPKLAILPAGPAVARPAELLHLGLREILESLEQTYQTVLIDSPPVLGFADSSAVVSLVHGTLLIVRAGQTSRDAVSAACRQLRAAQASIAGIVLNGISADISPYYNYYSSSYASYYARGEEQVDD